MPQRNKAPFVPGRFYQFRNLAFVPSVGATPLTTPVSSPPSTPASRRAQGSTTAASYDACRGSTEPHTALCISSPYGTRHSLFLLVTTTVPEHHRRHLSLRIVHNAAGPISVPGEVATIDRLGDALYLYLGRVHSFLEYAEDLDYGLLRNGVTRRELEFVVQGLNRIHSLNNSRHTLEEFNPASPRPPSASTPNLSSGADPRPTDSAGQSEASAAQGDQGWSQVTRGRYGRPRYWAEDEYGNTVEWTPVDVADMDPYEEDEPLTPAMWAFYEKNAETTWIVGELPAE